MLVRDPPEPCDDRFWTAAENTHPGLRHRLMSQFLVLVSGAASEPGVEHRQEPRTAFKRPQGVRVTYRRMQFPFERDGFARYWPGL